jgi:UDP-N-acetylmuramoylalanine--D-glutamate ligase
MKRGEFAGKKTAVLGLGSEGEALTRFLLDQGAEVDVFDRKGRGELEAVLSRLDHTSLGLRLGREDFGSLEGYDVVFRSPGIYRYREEIVAAEKAGAEISSETKLFFKLCPAPIIGVTGTKGKGTTSLLIETILKLSGRKTFVAGNLGPTRLNLLSKLDKESLVVLELSSFQLIDGGASPHLAVILNIAEDHLDWHKNVEEYRRAKENIVRFQKAADFAVVNADYPVSRRLARLTPAQVFWFSRRGVLDRGSFLKEGRIIFRDDEREVEVGSVADLGLKGEHNWENALAAATAAFLAGASVEAVRRGLSSFRGFPHRLEEIKKVKGVLFVNDSASTLPMTAAAALRTYRAPVVLICGGSEKYLDFSELGEAIVRNQVKAVILIGKTAPRIAEAIAEAGDYRGRLLSGGGSMAEIVAQAYSLAEEGDVVLLSPACASFDMFANYQDRGRQFAEAVEKLKE